MDAMDKNYILKSIINNDFVASETLSTISFKLLNGYSMNQLEKSLLILVIEHDPDLVEKYKEWLKEVIKNLPKGKDGYEKN